MASRSRKKPPKNPLLWVVEPIMDEPSYFEKAWFGCRAIYLHGKIMLALCSGEEPWNGLLIATEKEFHKDIRRDFGTVVQHPVLGKWLYLPENSENFESVASEIVEAIGIGDPRFGVEPKERVGRKGKRGD